MLKDLERAYGSGGQDPLLLKDQLITIRFKSQKDPVQALEDYDRRKKI